MTTIVNETIPAGRIKQFQEVLAATDGRFLCNPMLIGSSYAVRYETNRFAEHSEAWARCITPITEIRRDQPWRRALRRLKSML